MKLTGESNRLLSVALGWLVSHILINVAAERTQAHSGFKQAYHVHTDGVSR